MIVDIWANLICIWDSGLLSVRFCYSALEESLSLGRHDGHSFLIAAVILF